MHRIGMLGTSLLFCFGYPGLCAGQDASVAGTALFDRVLPIQELQRHRGGSDTKVLNFMDLDAALKENRASENVTGTNLVSSGAFSNASGLATVIQNSGNNVIIQNATILHLEMR